MHIEVRTDSRTKADIDSVTASVETGLARFRERLTRVEVHFSDVNGPKGGTDTRCVLEARPAGHQPVVVTSEASSSDDAVNDAVEKMSRLLTSTLDRLNETRGDSASGLPT